MIKMIRMLNCGDIPGFEKMVAPLNAPSKKRIGVKTNRGPISTRLVSVGPLGCRGSFSKICWCRCKRSEPVYLRYRFPTWKLRNQILPSSNENVKIWSMNGFALRAAGGTPKI